MIKPTLVIRTIWSLPLRGAWIEIFAEFTKKKKRERRSPCGERGLKYEIILPETGCNWSLPLRGAWIEIGAVGCVSAALGSLPLRGAWIEIAKFLCFFRKIVVAPLAGSVD